MCVCECARFDQHIFPSSWTESPRSQEMMTNCERVQACMHVCAYVCVCEQINEIVVRHVVHVAYI